MNKRSLFILFSLFLLGTRSQAQTTRWYSYTKYLSNETTVDSFAQNIWSDDTAKLIYPAYYSPTYFNSVGMSLGPVLDAWNDISLYGSTIKVTATDAYTVDTVRIRGSYFRNNLKPAPVDTLVLTFVYGNGTTTTNLQEGYFTSSPGFDLMAFYGHDTIRSLNISYDSVNNRGQNFPGVATPAFIQKIPLTNTDTAAHFNRLVALAAPLSVPAGHCAAMTLSFKSGDASYTPGDTVMYVSGAYKYGDFLPLIEYAASTPGTAAFPPYSPLDSNAGYFRQRNMYSSYWPEEYVPNWGYWNGVGGASGLQYPFIDFHVNCPTCISNDTIEGDKHTCVGYSTFLFYSSPGGTWSSSSVGVATVSASGAVTGIGVGTATISYTFSGHYVTTIVTVQPSPVVAAITGPSTICFFDSVVLSDSSPGGVWASGNPAVATVNSATGAVYGVNIGTATISYTVMTSCAWVTVTTIVTVNIFPSPGTISGTPELCAGASYTFTDGVAGGTWSSSATGIATVGSSGVVTGVATGTATISYTVSNACGSVTATTNISVNIPPSSGTITGPSTVCTTASISLTDAVSGGTWTATNTHAFISSTGTVLGVTAGVDTMMYTVSVTCATTTSAFASKVITINPAPAAGIIIGPDSVCIGNSITLSDVVAGGTWTAANSNAFVSSTGVVLGVTAGTDNITYTVNSACGTAAIEALIYISDCTLGIEKTEANDISLYPNPAQNSVTITAPVTISKVVINNIFGQQVFVGDFNSGKVVIGLDQLPSGIYVIKINDSRTYKLIKQ